jgi:hypothetical protein
MGIDEIDLTIYPYTVGREDCRVLPRSFKTLAEAKAYLAKQDKHAVKHGEFYLDGPEQDNAASNACGSLASDPEVMVPASPVTERGEPDSGCTPMPIQPQATPGGWKREIEELCRVLEGTDAD